METRWKKTIVTIALGAVIFFVAERLGLIDLSGSSSPVAYLLSVPEVEKSGDETVATYWLHVPDGTDAAVIEELLAGFLVPAIRRGSEGVGADGRKPEADTYRFLVFSTNRPGAEELKRPGIDTVDFSCSWSATNGLTWK